MFDIKQHIKAISNIVTNIDCKICGSHFSKSVSFALHVKHKHKLTTEQYYCTYVGKAVICPCGKNSKFISVEKGYKPYCCGKCHRNNLSGSKNPMYGRPKSEKFRLNQSKLMRENNPSKNRENVKKAADKQRGVPKNFSPEAREASRQRIKELNERGFTNRGGKAKFFKVNDVILQGRYELYYFLNNPNLTKPKQVKTPFGWYTPDFFDGTEYIEIKSTYTIKICEEGKQKDKINWFNDNVAKIKIEVLDDKKVDEFLKTIDVKQYIYHKKKPQ